MSRTHLCPTEPENCSYYAYLKKQQCRLTNEYLQTHVKPPIIEKNHWKGWFSTTAEHPVGPKQLLWCFAIRISTTPPRLLLKSSVKLLLDPRGCSYLVLRSVLSDSTPKGLLKTHQFTSGIKYILTQDIRDKPPVIICHSYIIHLYANTHLLHWNEQTRFFPPKKYLNV